MIRLADLHSLTTRLCEEHIKEKFGEQGDAICAEHEALIQTTIDVEVQKRSWTSSVVEFKIRRSTRLGKVFDAFCAKERAKVLNINGYKSYPFFFRSPGPDGVCVDPNSTALELQEDDT